MVKQMTGGQTMPADDAPQVPLNSHGTVAWPIKIQALTTGAQSHTENADSSDAPLSGGSKGFLARLSLPGGPGPANKEVPHHLILARKAALESGLGAAANPAGEWRGTQLYNVFGVKATASWKGPVTEITTTEYENGEAKVAKFRVYNSYLEALSGLCRAVNA